MSDEESVLKVALPPATDYLTYLTILEYNLDKDELPILHEVLQDEKLVTNIGWDLVHLLVPLLPESRQCLEDIASLGNPREVIIKVTEELEELRKQPSESNQGDNVAGSDEDDEELTKDDEQEKPDHESRTIAAFEALLHMLCMLHPRIKTKKPSRFLEASINAILGTYWRIAASPVATRAVLMFLKTLSGSSRPSLPPRSGEPIIPTVATHEPAPDPEADEDGPADGEDEAQARYLQVLVLCTIEMHLVGLEGQHRAPLAWTERFVAKKHPEWMLSERKDMVAAFEESEELRTRELLVNQILNVAMTDLHLEWPALLSIIRAPDEPANPNEPDAPPPFPKGGVACLMAAYIVRRTVSAAQGDEQLTFSDHDRLCTAITGDPRIALKSWKSTAVMDAIQRTGWETAPNLNFSAEVERDNAFQNYVIKLAFPAHHSTKKSEGYNAYLLATHVLQSHPSSRARLSFIRDQLPLAGHLPEKYLAVKWLQEEYVTLARTGFEDEGASGNVFAQPHTLKEMAPRVFYAEGIYPFHSFAIDYDFFNSGLNLLYLLCSSRPMREHLDVTKMVHEEDVERKYLKPLEELVQHETKVLQTENPEMDRSYLRLLEFSIGRAREGLGQLAEKASS